MKKQNTNIIDLKRVGKLTPEERDEIKRLYERKNGLTELFKTLTDVDKAETAKLYDKIVDDMARTTAQYQKWFEDASKKYSWKSLPGYSWQVDFDACEVFLKK